METTKAQYTIISDHNLQQIIQDTYGITPINCLLLMNELSEVYMIETKSLKYILKIYSAMHTNPEEVSAEIELLNCLHEGGVSVSYPIKNNKGSDIIFFESQKGSAFGVLYSCAPGQVSYYMNEEQVAAVAREIASMHNITARLQLKHKRRPLSIDNLLFNSLEKIKTAFADLHEDYNYLIRLSERIKMKLMDIDLDQCSYGYCHYDLLPHNFHFDEHGHVTFFDFELCGEGYLINDLVSFYAHYFLQLMHSRITHEEANRAFFLLIKNYTKVRPLTSIEIEVFPYFGFAFWIYHIAFDYKHFADRSHPGYLQDQVSYIRKWTEWYLQDKL
ncbi:MAG: phosphotransferase [Pedobacter sp.]|uniref:phosphotransferase enzyme family protein n=1 Tax=Pedobacter sp. TaxID=1411316 RepID=UPI0033915880